MEKSKFTTMIVSDQVHDYVFVEVYYEKKFIFLISQEEGRDKLKIEFPANSFDEKFIERVIYLEEFKWILDDAAKDLLEYKGW